MSDVNTETQASKSFNAEAFAMNIAKAMETSGQALAAYLKPREGGEAKDKPPSEVGEVIKTFSKVAEYWLSDNERATDLQTKLGKAYLDLWGQAARRMAGEQAKPAIEPSPRDKRFKDPEWKSNQFFDFVLQHEIEELVRFPLRILEALVARRRFDRRLGLFAGHAARGLAPEIEIGLAEFRLQVRGALIVRKPVFRDLGEGLDDLTDFARRLVLGFPALARLQIGRERLAARLHRLGDVHREGFGVEGLRSLGFGVDVAHIRDTIASFRVRHRVD